jgi:hypothetical protein
VPSSAALSISAWPANTSACSSSFRCSGDFLDMYVPGSSDFGMPCRMWLGEISAVSSISSSGASNLGSNCTWGAADFPFWVVLAC